MMFLTKRFIVNSNGNMVVMFAMSLVPILLALSLAIDFTRASDSKTRADAILDSTVLFAASKASQKGYVLDVPNLQKAAEDYFTSQSGVISNVALSAPIINISKSTSGVPNIKIEGRYTGTQMSWIKNPINGEKAYIPFSGYASSQVPLEAYVDIYFLLDTSPSMGVAVGNDSKQKMRDISNATGIGELKNCEFACHAINSDGSSGIEDTWSTAKANNVMLRIDVMGLAVASIIQKAGQKQVLSGIQNQYKTGIYSFSDTLNVVSGTNILEYTVNNGLTSDLEKSSKAATSLILSPYKNDDNYELTNYGTAFNAMNKIVSQAGDGSSSEAAQKILFLVTDGVQDAPIGSPSATNPKYTQWDMWKHSLAPINPDVCDTLKSNGVKIAVLYTVYDPFPLGVNLIFDYNLAHWIGDVSPALEACASPGLFYKAGNENIAEVMGTMFYDAVRQVRLTQ